MIARWGTPVAVITGAVIGLVLCSVGGVAAVGVMSAANTGSTGPDYAGIAALVAAVTGLISAVGALVIALRRRQPDLTDALAQAYLEEHGHEVKRHGDKKT